MQLRTQLCEWLPSTSIKSLDVVLTLSKDLLLFLVEKGEEEAAENQQKVISSLEDVKLKLRINYSKQTNLDGFIQHSLVVLMHYNSLKHIY